MFKKVAMPALLLATAVGGPVAFFAGSDYLDEQSEQSSTADAAAHPGAPKAGSPDGSPTAAPDAEFNAAFIDGAPVRDLAEVFRFEVTTDWIFRRWPRVSTGLAELQLQGYRVPLVTGTGEADLAGSLTYYFDAQQKVQRITFRGSTGDARNLVALVTGRHKFTRRLTNDPGLFVYEAASGDGQLRGLLKIRSAEIVKASDPYRRFDVELTIQRPS